MISDVALGFIAFAIGHEFRLSALKQTGKQATVIGIVQACVATLFVDIALISLHFIMPDILPLPVAITLGAIAAATAPAATLMVVRQYKAKGPVTDVLLPVVALLNYVLFFGKQITNLLPDFIRWHPTQKSWKRAVKQGTVYNAPRARDGARFRCTVCGRTEISNPGLEFRYCSKCAGYRCYCQDHINNHAHITE
jgi:hypothetical protein